MKEKDIIIDFGLSNNEDLEFICERRNKGVVFLDSKKNIYIKIGDKYKLKKEYEIQKQFIDLKFQVANILSSFENEEYFIYGEDKLGDKVIGQDISEGNISYFYLTTCPSIWGPANHSFIQLLIICFHLILSFIPFFRTQQ